MIQALKIQSKQKVLVMSTFCFLFCVVNMQSQDSIKKKCYHVVGFGTQFLNNIDKKDGGHIYNVNYHQPGLSLFYRYFFPYAFEKSITSANLFLSYREANAQTSTYSSGGNSFKNGYFEICRFDIGLSRLALLGKKKGINIGGGFGLGGLIYSNGEMKSNLYKVNASINFEISQRFKLSQRSFVLVGFKTQVETPEGFGTRLGLIETVFLGYMFR